MREVQFIIITNDRLTLMGCCLLSQPMRVYGNGVPVKAQEKVAVSPSVTRVLSGSRLITGGTTTDHKHRPILRKSFYCRIQDQARWKHFMEMATLQPRAPGHGHYDDDDDPTDFVDILKLFSDFLVLDDISGLHAIVNLQFYTGRFLSTR